MMRTPDAQPRPQDLVIFQNVKQRWGGTLRDKTKTAARETRSANDGGKQQNRASGLI